MSDSCCGPSAASPVAYDYTPRGKVEELAPGLEAYTVAGARGARGGALHGRRQRAPARGGAASCASRRRRRRVRIAARVPGGGGRAGARHGTAHGADAVAAGAAGPRPLPGPLPSPLPQSPGTKPAALIIVYDIFGYADFPQVWGAVYGLCVWGGGPGDSRPGARRQAAALPGPTAAAPKPPHAPGQAGG
jgi:hypothetical protein